MLFPASRAFPFKSVLRLVQAGSVVLRHRSRVPRILRLLASIKLMSLAVLVERGAWRTGRVASPLNVPLPILPWPMPAPWLKVAPCPPLDA